MSRRNGMIKESFLNYPAVRIMFDNKYIHQNNIGRRLCFTLKCHFFDDCTYLF